MENKEMTMKWHKFLTNFALWAAAVINVGNAVTYFPYAEYSGSFAVCGVILIALAIFGIVVRFALAGFKENAPAKLVTLNVVTAATGILFPVIIGAATGLSVGELMDSTTISQIAAGLAMAVYNKKYYAERAHMFVN